MSFLFNIGLFNKIISKEHLKKLCFINNIRSRFLTIFLVTVALFYSFYDIVYLTVILFLLFVLSRVLTNKQVNLLIKDDEIAQLKNPIQLNTNKRLSKK